MHDLSTVLDVRAAVEPSRVEVEEAPRAAIVVLAPAEDVDDETQPREERLAPPRAAHRALREPSRHAVGAGPAEP